jgi:head-tail adaptor
MALSNPPTAQELQHRVAIDQRTTVDDGAGNRRGSFEERFKHWAAFRSRGGSEGVVAQRLEGKNVVGVYVRSNPQTRTIESDWRMRDVRTGQTYAVKIVDAVTDRNWVYIEVQTGVAA